jgi:DNA processing protein
MTTRLASLVARAVRLPARMSAATRLRIWPFMVDCPVPPPREMSVEDLLGPQNDVENRHAPERLFVTGPLAVVHGTRRVAIIGTRKPSARGLDEARRWAEWVVKTAKGIVVSGLAAGIDTAAHVGALRAGGRTIAVLGTPLDKAYPAANCDLQARIAREHLLVSQFAPGTRTLPTHFILRNRTMALLSNASVIIEAGATSGTQHQAWEMLRLGRAVWLHPMLVEAPALKWPRELIEYGANVLTDPDLILDDLPEPNPGLRADAPF